MPHPLLLRVRRRNLQKVLHQLQTVFNRPVPIQTIRVSHYGDGP